MELYKKYRPKSLDEVVGQTAIVNDLKSRLKSGTKRPVPHAILFHGPSGTGKTTLARILAKQVGCKGDLKQINCATLEKPLEAMKGIEDRLGFYGVYGDVRVIILEECQALSRAGFAQQALLVSLEDTPKHVYFFLCTTDSNKILDAIKTRCTKYELSPIKPEEMLVLIARVLKSENAVISAEVLDKLVQKADGSAREALVSLEKVLGAESEEDQLEVLGSLSTSTRVGELVPLLLWKQPNWSAVAQILKNITDQEVEGIRIMVLNSASSVLLNGKGNPSRALRAVELFERNFYDGRRASLVGACYALLH